MNLYIVLCSVWNYEKECDETSIESVWASEEAAQKAVEQLQEISGNSYSYGWETWKVAE